MAGPVVAAAVMLPSDYQHPVLNDSKQLQARQRNDLRVEIEKQSIAWGVGFVTPGEIDRMNILRASILAMHQALESLSRRPGFLLIDGNRFMPFRNIPFKTVVKGDSTYYSIAAASVLAKTHRDEYMEKIHEEYPQYHWNQNKGYPTMQHKKAIRDHGISPYHRKSFHLIDVQASLDF